MLLTQATEAGLRDQLANVRAKLANGGSSVGALKEQLELVEAQAAAEAVLRKTTSLAAGAGATEHPTH